MSREIWRSLAPRERVEQSRKHIKRDIHICKETYIYVSFHMYSSLFTHICLAPRERVSLYIEGDIEGQSLFISCCLSGERVSRSEGAPWGLERREIIYRENTSSRERMNRIERESTSISRKIWRSFAPRERINHLQRESFSVSREIWRSLAPRQGVSLHI